MLIPISNPVTVGSLPKLSDVDQKKFDTVKANLQSALDTLKTSSKNNSVNVQRKAQAKAMAQQRIAQIKQSMTTLRQMHGLDAKGTARMIAQLAKQLAQAVKDYQSAGGTDMVVSSGADTSLSANNANNSVQTASDSSNTVQKTATSAYAQTQQITGSITSAVSDEYRQFFNQVNQLKNDLRSFTKQLRNNLKSGWMSNSFNPDLKEIRSAENALDEIDSSLSK